MSVPPHRLHIRSTGSGPDLVLLHGWGLHGELWGEAAERLAGICRVHRVDLPGHGHSPWSDGTPNSGTGALDSFAHAVVEILPPRCLLLGWSLGGMVALRIAHFLSNEPAKVAAAATRENSNRPATMGTSSSELHLAGLILVCSTPKFLASDDWPHGMRPEALEDFAQRLERDYSRTVRDFLSLQLQGETRPLELLRQMKRALDSAPAPQPAALAAGLEILRTTDLRATLPSLHLPTLVISGGLDRMTPPAAGSYLAGHIGGAVAKFFPKAAHAPFLSHAEAFTDIVSTFANEAIDEVPSRRMQPSEPGTPIKTAPR